MKGHPPARPPTVWRTGRAFCGFLGIRALRTRFLSTIHRHGPPSGLPFRRRSIGSLASGDAFALRARFGGR